VDALDKRNFEKTQLELDLIWDQEIKEATERCSAEDPVETKSHSQKSLVDRLSCGEHFNFAGQLIHNCFLNKIGLDEISSIYPVKSGNVYQNQDILSTIFHSINLGVPSIEGLKLINPSDMGLLIGHSRGPDKNTIRRQLAQMGDLDQSDTLIDNIAQILLEQNFIDREVFFYRRAFFALLWSESHCQGLLYRQKAGNEGQRALYELRIFRDGRYFLY